MDDNAKVYRDNNESFKCPHYYPFVSGIHWWPEDSPHKKQGMRKAFSYHDVIIISIIYLRPDYCKWNLLDKTLCHPLLYVNVKDYFTASLLLVIVF